MPFIGHWHALVVAEEQPVKMAAFEALYDTQENAPLYLFGWVRDDDGEPEVTGLAIPSGLSLMLGLEPVAPGDRPRQRGAPRTGRRCRSPSRATT